MKGIYVTSDSKRVYPYGSMLAQVVGFCGIDMDVLTANTTEAATEKHIPVVEINGNIAKVTVGEVLHPMEEAHYIEWIYLETNKGIKRVNLKPGDEPIASFALAEDETVTSAYAYCNLHGLWLKELK